ncbi:MAG: hypothetical protein WBV33_20335, partial [Terracidiphilus sp.]
VLSLSLGGYYLFHTRTAPPPDWTPTWIVHDPFFIQLFRLLPFVAAALVWPLVWLGAKLATVAAARGYVVWVEEWLKELHSGPTVPFQPMPQHPESHSLMPGTREESWKH